MTFPVTMCDPRTLIPYAANPRRNTQAVPKVAASIREYGFRVPLVIDTEGTVVCGHTRLEAALLLELPEVPCHIAEDLTEAQLRAFRLVDNRVSEIAEWDEELLDLELQGLAELGIDLDEFGLTLDDLDTDTTTGRTGSLAERFLVPPFSILDTRSGLWQERRRAWLALGIQSELGRGNGDDNAQEGLTFSLSAQPPEVYQAKAAYEKRIGHEVSWEDFAKVHPEAIRMNGTSIFDPVLCELAYRWFCTEGGRVLDPFAGGSVRGIVAGKLGLSYMGIELRPEQVTANQAQKETLLPEADVTWITGDSERMLPALSRSYDLLFSCPPYGDLEVYSDDPADLSNMSWENFLQSYRHIIEEAALNLKENRFAVFVVTEIRDKKGHYRGLVPETIKAFQDAGLTYYNEACLINQAASLAMRAGRTFAVSRKLGRCHQNVLVFYKGNTTDIRQTFPQAIEIGNTALDQEDFS